MNAIQYQALPFDLQDAIQKYFLFHDELEDNYGSEYTDDDLTEHENAKDVYLWDCIKDRIDYHGLNITIWALIGSRRYQKKGNNQGESTANELPMIRGKSYPWLA